MLGRNIVLFLMVAQQRNNERAHPRSNKNKMGLEQVETTPKSGDFDSNRPIRKRGFSPDSSEGPIRERNLPSAVVQSQKVTYYTPHDHQLREWMDPAPPTTGVTSRVLKRGLSPPDPSEGPKIDERNCPPVERSTINTTGVALIIVAEPIESRAIVPIDIAVDLFNGKEIAKVERLNFAVSSVQAAVIISSKQKID
jgi:hypothetical protein